MRSVMATMAEATGMDVLSAASTTEIGSRPCQTNARIRPWGSPAFRSGAGRRRSAATRVNSLILNRGTWAIDRGVLRPGEKLDVVITKPPATEGQPPPWWAPPEVGRGSDPRRIGGQRMHTF